MVAHNPAFDLGFLNAAVERCDVKCNPFHPFSTFDTATLGVDANTAPAVVRFMLRMHTLAVGRAVATFGFPAQ